MDEMQAKHRKEQRDLQSRITQKKKSATKKSRKEVNADCERLEADLKSSQEREIAELNGTVPPENAESEIHGKDQLPEEANGEGDHIEIANGHSDLQKPLDSLSLASSAAQEDGQPQAAPARKPNRQKARLARRAAEQEALVAQAAEEAANLPDLREQERKTISKELDRLGLREREIRPDGHCLYSAVADQLSRAGVNMKPEVTVKVIENVDEKIKEAPAGYKTVRSAAADYISQNPDDFVPFLEEPLEEYTHKVRDTAEWGGQLELLALARTYGVGINVLQGDGRVEKIRAGEDTGGAEGKAIWLAYYRHHFGLGEHYNSLYQGP